MQEADKFRGQAWLALPGLVSLSWFIPGICQLFPAAPAAAGSNQNKLLRGTGNQSKKWGWQKERKMPSAVKFEQSVVSPSICPLFTFLPVHRAALPWLKIPWLVFSVCSATLNKSVADCVLRHQVVAGELLKNGLLSRDCLGCPQICLVMSGCQQFVLKLPTISVQLSRLRIFLSVMRSCTLSITVVCSATPSTTFRCPSLRPRASSLLHVSPSSGLTTDSPSFEPQGYQHPEHGDPRKGCCHARARQELRRDQSGGICHRDTSLIQAWLSTSQAAHPILTLGQWTSSRMFPLCLALCQIFLRSSRRLVPIWLDVWALSSWRFLMMTRIWSRANFALNEYSMTGHFLFPVLSQVLSLVPELVARLSSLCRSLQLHPPPPLVSQRTYHCLRLRSDLTISSKGASTPFRFSVFRCQSPQNSRHGLFKDKDKSKRW